MTSQSCNQAHDVSAGCLGRPVGNSNSTRDTGRSTYDSVGSGKGVNMGSTTVAAGIKGKPQPHPRQAE